MKYTFLFILILTLLNFNAKSQKCDYEKNEVDAVTDLLIKRTKPLMITRINGQPLYVKAQCIGDNKYLKLRVYNYSDFDIQEEREISFTLTNKEEVTLYPRIMPVDSSKIDDLTNISTMMVYKLTMDQFQLLKESPVSKFKYFLDSGWVEENIKEKKQDLIMEVLKCIE